GMFIDGAQDRFAVSKSIEPFRPSTRSVAMWLAWSVELQAIASTKSRFFGIAVKSHDCARHPPVVNANAGSPTMEAVFSLSANPTRGLRGAVPAPRRGGDHPRRPEGGDAPAGHPAAGAGGAAVGAGHAGAAAAAGAAVGAGDAAVAAAAAAGAAVGAGHAAVA